MATMYNNSAARSGMSQMERYSVDLPLIQNLDRQLTSPTVQHIFLSLRLLMLFS